MSCTVYALPSAIAWIANSIFTGKSYTDFMLDKYGNNMDANCEDIHIISKQDILEKSFETPFVDKNILIKTLEEHGVQNISEDLNGNLSGYVENYSMRFERKKENQPYSITISYIRGHNVEEKFNDISNEYNLNVQEETYLNIVEKLKENDMEIEEEDILEDNTIVLTINIE